MRRARSVLETKKFFFLYCLLLGAVGAGLWALRPRHDDAGEIPSAAHADRAGEDARGGLGG